MKIHYLTGNRADFGLIESSLKLLNQNASLDLGIIIGGQHFSDLHGNTFKNVIDSNLNIVKKLDVTLTGEDEYQMAMAFSDQINQLTKFWKADPPDLLLILGDRGEMLAAAITAIHLGIFVAHIHGGERSGTLDESFRHSISKLAHFHFVASKDSAERLIKMGEDKEQIHIIGAPGLVGIKSLLNFRKNYLDQFFNFKSNFKTAVFVYHPVVQERKKSLDEAKLIIEVLIELNFQIISFKANSDAGGFDINKMLSAYQEESKLILLSNKNRKEYLNILYHSDLLIGNSSSGIIESASLNLPCVNVGSRQNLRLRNANLIDVNDVSKLNLKNAIKKIINFKGPYENLYGDGNADKKLLKILNNINLDKRLLQKSNVY